MDYEIMSSNLFKNIVYSDGNPLSLSKRVLIYIEKRLKYYELTVGCGVCGISS
jgi:hypothetical protein